MLVSVILLSGNIVFNVGLTDASGAGAVIVTTLSACYPALTIVLALRHLDEEVETIPLVGAFVAIIGVVTLSAS